MADYERLGDAFDEMVNPQDKPPAGRLGYEIETGVFKVIDPDDPKKYLVRFPNGNFVGAFHKNRVPQKPGYPVLIDYDQLGRPVIVGPDPSEIDNFLQDDPTGGAAVGPHDHVRNSGREFVIDTWLLKRLRTTVTSGFVVQIDGGWYLHHKNLNWWTTKTVDLSSYLPSNPDMVRWIVIGINPLNDSVISLVPGDEYIGSEAGDPRFVPAVQFVEQGFIACAAIYLRGSDTSVLDYRIEDLRYAAGQMIDFLQDLRDVSSEGNYYGYVLGLDGSGYWVGVPESGGTSALADLTDVDVTTVPPADQQALIYDLGRNLWIPGEVSFDVNKIMVNSRGQVMTDARGNVMVSR